MKTNQYSLRPLDKNDGFRMLEWMRDPDITRYLRIGGPQTTLEQINSFIANSQDSKDAIHRAVVDKNNLYMGTVSLKNIDSINQEAEYAISMHPSALGIGAAYEASSQILEFAFENLGLKRVYLNVLLENQRAVKFYTKFGFRFSHKTTLCFHGENKELLWYEIKKAEYEKIKPNSDQSILIIEFTNDNHLSNVKTLQSIFRQKGNLFKLVVCNDCTDGFQCERFLYNITGFKPDNFQKVEIIENLHPIGENASVRRILDEYDASYAFIIHSGEYLVNPNILNKCAAIIRDNLVADALAVSVERRSEDLKTTIEYIKIPDWEINVELPEDAFSQLFSKIRDCNFFYRGSSLKAFLNSNTNHENSIFKPIITGYLNEKFRIEKQPFSVCMFSFGSINNPDIDIPLKLGNERLRKIANKLTLQGENEISANSLQSTDVITTVKLDNKRKWGIWFYKHSRFQRIKVNMIIALLLFILSLLLNLKEVPTVVIIAIMAVSALMMIWIIAMFCCNLYYRKHPERLVYNDV